MSDDAWLSAIKFDAEGLVPVVAQESRTGDVLMVAYADRDALQKTRTSGLAHYFSRSRRSLWQKGESSGHIQRVRQIRVDCDGDAVLYRVAQTGPACHTGEPTCFATLVTPEGTPAHTDAGSHVLSRLAARIADRAATRPPGSYTARLLDDGPAAAGQKVGEEAVEVVVAALAQDDGRVAAEAADLLYHLLVLLRARNVPLDRVWDELEARFK